MDITGSGGEKKADQAESGKSEEDFLRNRKILLAEDNEINMEIACELLDMYGAQVVKAWNGKEAVDLFAASGEDEFDVILMDMQMPEMDGCEAARTIRKMKRRDAEKIPIIAVTAQCLCRGPLRDGRGGNECAYLQTHRFQPPVQDPERGDRPAGERLTGISHLAGIFDLYFTKGRGKF